MDVTLSPTQKKAAKKWKELLDKGELKVETQNESAFIEIILNDLLGYPKAWEGLNQKVDYMDVSFPPSPKRGIVFELKGKGKDLFKPQHYDNPSQQTPILQTMNYINENPGYEYGICTNYEEFVLITKEYGISQCYRFKFPDENQQLTEEHIREFVGIFSKDRIVDLGFVDKLHHESVIEEKELTEDFYKLFHETRLMLKQSFEDDNKMITSEQAIKYAQMYLNRLIFIFFAEDNNLITIRLFTEEILKILEAEPNIIKEGTTKISDQIQTIFTWMDSGSNEIDNRLGFNGEFFNESIDRNAFFYDISDQSIYKEIRKKIKFKKRPRLNPELEKICNRFDGKLNPIITNLLIMDGYDFKDQINVNILGHIFEQSIGDLEELRNEVTTKRKKDGVFYTPEYITNFICKNTIIPYLSKKGVTDPHDLVLEYSDNINELEQKFKEIKIVDPACGSGAFLVKSIEVLTSIYEEIQSFKQNRGAYTVTKKGKKSGIAVQATLDKETEDVIARGIIQNNIYGVDINPESVEITKLSLFLKIATKNKKLIGLSERIKVGNSLIDDKNIDDRAFCWESNFPEVMKFGKFDIVIGNPPYVRVQYLPHKHIDWYKKNKKTPFRRVDLSTIFFELAESLIHKDGKVCFISSNQFLVTDYGKKSREFLLQNFQILNIIDFGWLPVFEDALTYVSIFNLKKGTPSNFPCLKVSEKDFGKPLKLNQSFNVEISNLSEKPWVLWDKPTLNLLAKLKKFPKIRNMGNAGTGLFTGLDDILLLNNEQISSLGLEKNILLPVIVGHDSSKYGTIKPKEFVIYPYKLVGTKTLIFDELYFKNNYIKTYKYLKDNKDLLLERKDSRKTFKEKKDWFGLTRFGQLEIFKREKIVTPGEVRENKFTIDMTGSGFLNARVFCIIIDDKKYDIRYVLGMLNSKIIEFFLHKTAPLKQGGYFAYSSKFLNDVSIPLIEQSIQLRVKEKVSKLLEIFGKIQEQNDEFGDLLKANLSLTITENLNNFVDLELDEFIKELTKQKKKLSLEEQSQWRKFFNTSKNQILDYLKEAKKIEGEIEEISYSVYDLDKNEINLILKDNAIC